MKIAIIGCSGHSDYAIDSIKNNNKLKLVAIAPGTKEESLETLEAWFSKEEMQYSKYENYKTMLDNIEIDLCVVNTYFYQQSKIGIEVIKKGIHLFIEKPIATNLKDFYKLKRVYGNYESRLCAMFGIRYKAWFLKAKELIELGCLGKIRLMEARKSYKLGSRKDFYKKRSTYGGTISWVGSHAVDWLRWLSKLEVIGVKALDSRQDNNNHGELENSAVCMLEFEQECYGMISVDFLRPINAPTHDDDYVRIVGTKGVLEIRHSKVYLTNWENDGTTPVALNQDKQIFDDFINSIINNVPCGVSGEDSFKGTEVCLLAQQSADKGGKNIKIKSSYSNYIDQARERRR